MEVAASIALNEAAASCSESPASSSAALPSAAGAACSAASLRKPKDLLESSLELLSKNVGVPVTPEKPMQAALAATQVDQQHPQAAAAAGDGSSSNVPDIPQALPAPVDGPIFLCANPMGSMTLNAPFTPQRLPALQALQTPMQVCMAPMVVTFQAAYPMGPGGPMAAYPVMAQAAMAQASAAAAAAAAASAPVRQQQQQPQQVAIQEPSAEVSPDVIARFEVALRGVMTQPLNDPSNEQPAGDGFTPAPAPAVGGSQWTQSSTGFKGVTKHKRTKRFEAHIWGHKQQVYLGSFDQGIQAARAHDIMALCNHGGVVYPGSHSSLNFSPVLYFELLPFLGHLSQGDVLAALRSFGKKTPAARRAAAATAAPAPSLERKRKADSSPLRTARSSSHNAAYTTYGSKRHAATDSSEEEEQEAEDVDAEEAAALLHHFANGRLR